MTLTEKIKKWQGLLPYYFISDCESLGHSVMKILLFILFALQIMNFRKASFDFQSFLFLYYVDSSIYPESGLFTRSFTMHIESTC